MPGVATQDDLLVDLDDFLRSSATNVEWMSGRLRSELTVPTDLERVVSTAADEGRQIVVAGTAGSGKTHLLQSANLVNYDKVPDLTSHPEGEWNDLLDRQRIVVAGNEGAFLQGKKKGYKGFDGVISALHAIQRGEDLAGDGPVVIDAAGYDPAGSRSIARMLEIPLLARYVETRCPPSAFDAWKMLENPIVRDRVAFLVEAASAESDADGFTFRQLWQFVADLIVGNGAETIWFEQMFAGRTEVSRRVAQTFDPASLALPHVGNQLWHSDLLQVRSRFLPESHAILERILPGVQRDAGRLAAFNRLRLLAAFGMSDSPVDDLVRSGMDLWAKVRQLDVAPLLQAINTYFSFGLLQLGNDLELWLQHATERRLTKPELQLSLGTADVGGFKLMRSGVVANRPKSIPPVNGGRMLLVHSPSGASLAITKDLIDGIIKTRSHKTNERKDVEYDWRLSEFFEQVAACSSKPHRLKVARFDFKARTGSALLWQIASNRIRKVAV